MEVLLPEEQRNEAREFLMHPALLDASLHALGSDLLGDAKDGPRVPFAWSGVCLHAVGASTLRVRLSPVGADGVSLTAVDENGAAVLSVESLVSRAFSPTQSGGLHGGGDLDSLYAMEWVEASVASASDGSADGSLEDWVFLGNASGTVDQAGESHSDLESLQRSIELGRDVPQVIVVPIGCLPGRSERDVSEDGVVGMPFGVRARVFGALDWLQRLLGDERFVGCRVVLVSSGAVGVGDGEGVLDLAGGAVWGLMSSAQSENPGRFVVVDVDGSHGLVEAVRGALGCGEGRVAVRAGVVLVPRLAHVGASGSGLGIPTGAPEWCLCANGDGSLDGLSLVEVIEPVQVLGAGEVRVGVRAAGLNFRDVLIALGVYPERASIGGEGAGVVLEVGPGVLGFEPGDRVMGLFGGAFGPVAVADHRLLARVPDGWSFAQAASVPIVFLTACYAFVDLAHIREGERLLVHAGTGGVGMAAIAVGASSGCRGVRDREYW